jgi:hypothetical protein
MNGRFSFRISGLSFLDDVRIGSKSPLVVADWGVPLRGPRESHGLISSL